MDPDPDPDSLAADHGASRARWSWSRRRRGGGGSGGGQAEGVGGPGSRAQAEQDAWVARWPGWRERGLLDGEPPTAPPVRQAEGPAGSEAERPTRRRWYRQRRNLVMLALGMVCGIGIARGLMVELPYVALVPGTARDTEPLLAVEGVDGYPSDGELLFTTVRIRRQPNLWEYLWLTFDDDATLVPAEEIMGDRTADEDRELNMSLMNDSKLVAVAVALEELGYDAIGTDGVVVQQLVPETPADETLELGDTIVAIDGEPTLATTSLVEILADHRPGDRIELTVEDLAGTSSKALEIALGENPDNPGAGFLGIQPADRIQYGTDLGFTVDIDSGSVGGPSAGLAFALAVLDQLTEGELTGGARVAVTGTMQADGRVGPVGGVLQKTAAVRDLGIDVFLVPAGLPPEEMEAIEDRAGDELDIVPVASLTEALSALGELGGDVGAVEEFAAANPATG